MEEGPAAAALGASGDLETRDRVDEVPGHRMGEAGTRAGFLIRGDRSHFDPGAEECCGERFVDQSIAIGRGGEGESRPGGHGESEGQVPAMLDQASSGETPHRLDLALLLASGAPGEISHGFGRVIPGVETDRRRTGRESPIEEPFVERHVLRRRPEGRVSPDPKVSQGGRNRRRGRRGHLGRIVMPNRIHRK